MTESFAHLLLNRLLGPDPAARESTLRLISPRADLVRGLRLYLDARLTDDPADRLRPALLIHALYGDHGPLLRVTVEALRSDAPDDDVREAVLELTTVAVPKLLIECAFVRPALFSLIFERSPRWVTRLLISEGRPGILTLRLFVAELGDPLLHQVASVIADEAITSPHDLTPLVRPLSAVRLRPNARFEVGLALWRITWQLDDEFVTHLTESRALWCAPHLLASAVLDMLPLTARLDEVVGKLLEPSRASGYGGRSSVTRDRSWIAPIVRRVLGMGPRGVKLLLTVDPHHDDGYLPFRAELLMAAAETEWHCRAFLPVAQRVIESPSLHVPGADPPDALRAACRMIANVGAAETILPNLFALADAKAAAFPDLRAAVATVARHRRADTAKSLLANLKAMASDITADNPPNEACNRFEGLACFLWDTGVDCLSDVLTDDDLTPDFVAELFFCTMSMSQVVLSRIDSAPEKLAVYLVDARPAVRARAVAVLERSKFLVDRLWAWLVAAIAVPVDNPELCGLFAQVRSARDQVVTELIPLTTDLNPVIAANGIAALQVLNVAT